MADKILSTLFYTVLLAGVLAFANNGSNSGAGLEKEFQDWAGRQFASRMVWMTHQRRFVLPKGTILQITPKITVPVFRHAPYDGGFDSDIQASWTFYMKFDKLNMTSDDHPWPFDRPPFYPFGEMMRPNAGESSKGEKVTENRPNFHSGESGHKPFPNIRYSSSEESKSLPLPLHTIRGKNVYPAFKGQKGHKLRRRPRAIMSLPPASSLFGGERANIFPSLEGLLSSIGLEGRGCLLRAVCEVHQHPLVGYGLFGELVTTFFSVSESSYAESHLPEYLKAEEIGKTSGDCKSYTENCKRSLFVWEPRPGFEKVGESTQKEKVKDS